MGAVAAHPAEAVDGDGVEVDDLRDADSLFDEQAMGEGLGDEAGLRRLGESEVVGRPGAGEAVDGGRRAGGGPLDLGRTGTGEDAAGDRANLVNR